MVIGFDTPVRVCVQITTLKKSFDETVGGITDDHGIGPGALLNTGSDIRCLAQSKLFSMLSFTHFPNNNSAGMYCDAHLETKLFRHLLCAVQLIDGFHNLKTAVDRASCIVLVCIGITEIDQHAVAEILCDMSFIIFYRL